MEERTVRLEPISWQRVVRAAKTLFVTAILSGNASIQAQTGSAAPATCAKVDTVKAQEYVGIIQNLVPWVALDQGIFKKYCLDVKMTNFPSGPAALAASLQGGLDFLSLAPDTVYVPVSQGMDLKIVAFMNDTIHYVLVVGKHVPLPNKDQGYPAVMKDLIGKKIGTNAFGSTTDALARAALAGAGIDPTQANWVAYGPPAAGIAGLINGSLDAGMFFGDGMDIAAAATGGTIIVDHRDPKTATSKDIAAMRGASLMWVAQNSFIKANPDVVRRFARANNEAIAWIKDPTNFEAVVKIVRERAPSPPNVGDPEALLRERVKRYIPQENAHGSMRALQAWNQWDVAVKRIPKPADVDALLYETAREMIVP